MNSFSFLLVFGFFLVCDVSGKTSYEEIQALQSLYWSLGGKSWSRSSYWLSGDPCEDYWLGIECDRQKEHVLSVFVDFLFHYFPFFSCSVLFF